MKLQEIKIFRELFNDQYPHVGLYQMDDKALMYFLKRDYVKNVSITRQLDLCYDFVLSQGIVDVQE